jgi:hypothetical protein
VTITIKTQEEFDALPNIFDEFTVVQILSKKVITVNRTPINSKIEALGNSQVIAWGSYRIEARNSSRIVARHSSQVVAWDSSRIEA